MPPPECWGFPTERLTVTSFHIETDIIPSHLLDTLTPFEAANPGYSIGWLGDDYAPSDQGRAIMYGPNGWWTMDLHVITDKLRSTHPTALAIQAADDKIAHAIHIDRVTYQNTNHKEHAMSRTATTTDPEGFTEDNTDMLNGLGLAGDPIIDKFSDPSSYSVNMETLEIDPELMIDLTNRVETWIQQDWTVVAGRNRAKDNTRVVGRVPLDVNAIDGRPSIYRAEVDHVVFVCIPKSDRAYRPTGVVAPNAGVIAAVLVTPGNYVRGDGSLGAALNDNTVRAIRFYSGLHVAKADMRELEQAIRETNTPARLEAIEVARLAAAERAADDGFDNAPF